MVKRTIDDELTEEEHILDVDVTFGDLAGPQCGVEDRPFAGVGERAHPVGAIDRLAGRRAHLADDQPAVVVGRQVQQQVGDAEVGEHAPFRGEPIQVAHLFAVEGGVFAYETGERCHHCSVWRNSPVG